MNLSPKTQTMNDLPNEYLIWVINRLYSETKTDEDITIAFNLHNQFVNPNNPSFSKSCSPCVKKVINLLKQTYTEKMIIEYIDINQNI